MHSRLLLVELPEDGGAVLHAARAQAEESGCRARDLTGERQLRARHDADRRVGIFRRREAPCAGSEIACRELVADSRGTRLHVVQAVIAHGEDSFPRSPPWPLELAKARIVPKEGGMVSRHQLRAITPIRYPPPPRRRACAIPGAAR